MTISFENEVFDNIPESYHEMSLGQFMEISQINLSDFTSKTEWTVKMIATLIGCPQKYLLQLTIGDLSLLMEEFAWISVLPEIKDLTALTIDGVKYVTKSQTQLTTGEWISVEQFLKNDISNEENFHIILAILLREADEKNEIKPLENNFDLILKRANLFKNKVMITECYGMIKSFSNGAKKSTLKITKGFSTQKD